MPESPQWNSRIVGYADVDPRTLLANKYNFRNHPKSQQNAFLDTIEAVGFLQNVLVNKTTGRIVDGHLRVSLAVKQGQETIPVTYVELDEDEERLALSTFDPMGSLARTDNKKLDALIESLKSEHGELADIQVEQNLFDDISPIDTAPLRELTEKAEDKPVAPVETGVTCPKCNHRF